MKVSLSFDLLLFCSKYVIANKSVNELKFVQSFFEMYEFFCKFRVGTFVLSYYESFLVSLIENVTCLKGLEDYFGTNKYYNSFTLCSNQIADRLKNSSSLNDISFTNSLQKLDSFYADLLQFLADNAKAKTQSSQVLMKKLVAHIECKCGLELAKLAANQLMEEPNRRLVQHSQLMQSICKRIIQLLKLDFVDKYLQLLEITKNNNDNLCGLLKFIYSTVFIWSKLINKEDIEQDAFIADLDFMFSFLTKCPADRMLIQVLNFKIQTAYLLSLLAVKEIKEASLCKRIVEMFCGLLNDSNAMVKTFTLECLNEFLQSSPTNNKLLSEIVRSSLINAKVKEELGEYLSQSVSESSRTYEEVLKLRYEALINKNLNCQIKDDRIDVNQGEFVEVESEKELMDETLDAILCAMDTTLNPSNDLSQSSQASNKLTRKKEQQLLELIEKDLDSVVDKCAEDKHSAWFNERVLALWNKKILLINSKNPLN